MSHFRNFVGRLLGTTVLGAGITLGVVSPRFSETVPRNGVLVPMDFSAMPPSVVFETSPTSMASTSDIHWPIAGRVADRVQAELEGKDERELRIALRLAIQNALDLRDGAKNLPANALPQGFELKVATTEAGYREVTLIKTGPQRRQLKIGQDLQVSGDLQLPHFHNLGQDFNVFRRPAASYSGIGLSSALETGHAPPGATSKRRSGADAPAHESRIEWGTQGGHRNPASSRHPDLRQSDQVAKSVKSPLEFEAVSESQ